MADVTVQQQVILRVSDKEWRLIMKSLAHFVGIKVSIKGEDKQVASDLNKELLRQRVAVLALQLEQAQKTLTKAEIAGQPDPEKVEAAVDRIPPADAVGPALTFGSYVESDQ